MAPVVLNFEVPVVVYQEYQSQKCCNLLEPILIFHYDLSVILDIFKTIVKYSLIKLCSADNVWRGEFKAIYLQFFYPYDLYNYTHV